MKIKTINITTALLSATLLIASCSTPTQNTEEAVKAPAEKKQSTDPVAIQYVNVEKSTADFLIASYIELKDAMVETNSSLAQEKAIVMMEVIKDAENEVLATLANAIQKIANGEEISTQREDFEVLSNEMYTLVKETENNSVTLYKQYCPMAFDNKGAFWLSTEEAVLNPYFGDRMLKCGVVQETLHTRQ